jgi:regulatory associated protein of mTOR
LAAIGGLSFEVKAQLRAHFYAAKRHLIHVNGAANIRSFGDALSIMTRSGRDQLLPEEAGAHPSRHPQPVVTLDAANDFVVNPPSAFHQRPSTSQSHTNGTIEESEEEEEEEEEDEGDGGLHMRPGNRHPQGEHSLSRAQSDASRYSHFLDGTAEQAEEADGQEDSVQIRHGFHAQLEDKEQANKLSENFFMYYEDKRHETGGNPPLNDELSAQQLNDWRMRDRLKTVSAVLALCLNVGVDPPDVIKTNPCARMECWVDPIPLDNTNTGSSTNANAQIGKNLQAQYETLSVRTRYKVVLDPTLEELKRFTVNLRKQASYERLLFHYNGHGVPKPTQSGEVWCFNRSYTQYIPVSLYDLQEWIAAPSIWVWDCSASGGIIDSFLEASKKHMDNQTEALRRDPSRMNHEKIYDYNNTVHLAACDTNQVLPTNPDLPADIFTACLTTPIKMAIRFFMLQRPLSNISNVTLAEASDIPGKVSERRTPLGELNWIFTAITDTIAWSRLPRELFKKLFRQDLMVAALFRNFLLAERVMRKFNCTPKSYPELPPTYDHKLWDSWDLAVEMIIAQLPSLIQQQKDIDAHNESQVGLANPTPAPELEYDRSTFFADQLTAFEVYLTTAPPFTMDNHPPEPPKQLPIVLQVLLSQVHRLRALILLSKVLDLGPWAVNLALSIGIFPYVLKLLQSQAIELKPPMVFIWARILAVDVSVQGDLLKDNGYLYFANILGVSGGMPVGNAAEHRAMCAFVIAKFCEDFKHGKDGIFNNSPVDVMGACLKNSYDMENPLLRQFSLLCLKQLWKDYPPGKIAGLQHQAHGKIMDRSHDPVPEVRAACLDALTSFIEVGDVDAAAMMADETIASVVSSMGMDGSIMVRKELTVFYSVLIKKYEKKFVVCAWEQLLEERDKKLGRDEDRDLELGIDRYDGANDVPTLGSTATERLLANGSASYRPNTSGNATQPAPRPTRRLSKKSIYRTVWRQLLTMSTDPHPEVARNASIVVDYVVNLLLQSQLGGNANEVLDQILVLDAKRSNGAMTAGMDSLSKQRSREYRPETPPSPASTTSKADGYFSGLTRSTSYAARMMNFWKGKTPGQETPPSPTRAHRGSFQAETMPYRSRPLTGFDASMIAPDAFDKFQGPAHQPPATLPPPPGYVPHNPSDAPIVPVLSTFFSWSASYFREPQMRPSESDEPGSQDYNSRLWRRARNDQIMASTQPLKEEAGRQKWDTPYKYFGIGAAPAKMVFHQFEDHLITSDDRDSIAVWDWNKEKQLCRFSNGNPAGSRVTELRFINEDDKAMIMTGSSDGVIKVFKNYEKEKTIELATSFRALNDLVVSDRQNAGLVFDWQQGQGRILVAGDERVIRVWQAGHELCVTDINARSGSCITSLTSDQVEGNVFVAGFGNGSVRVYDQREKNAMVKQWSDKKIHHKSWIVGVHLQRGGLRELISAESNGGVRLWDIRADRPLESLPGSDKPRNLRCLSVHEHAPVFATGSHNHIIRVYNTQMRELSWAEPYMSLLRFSSGPRNAPITATAFHPHRMMLACGAVNDGHVNLYKCDIQESKKGEDDGLA